MMNGWMDEWRKRHTVTKSSGSKSVKALSRRNTRRLLWISNAILYIKNSYKIIIINIIIYIIIIDIINDNDKNSNCLL